MLRIYIIARLSAILMLRRLLRRLLRIWIVSLVLIGILYIKITIRNDLFVKKIQITLVC